MCNLYMTTVNDTTHMLAPNENEIYTIECSNVKYENTKKTLVQCNSKENNQPTPQ